MAKARMLHKSVSTSLQVNKLSLSARLLFTWTIAHADDEGRLKGDPAYVKATVVPMTKWSFKKIGVYLDEVKNVGLIYYWQQNSEWFIEFVKWNEFQQIRKDRFIPSKLPSFNDNSDNQTATINQPADNQPDTQANISESNLMKSNKSEYNSIAGIKTSKNEYIDPSRFRPTNAGEVAALDIFNKLEPNNPKAFATTYLAAYKRGLPVSLFYRYTSEIKQDNTIKNLGAVFNKKVDEYFNK